LLMHKKGSNPNVRHLVHETSESMFNKFLYPECAKEDQL
jgi:hypothetical protein